MTITPRNAAGTTTVNYKSTPAPALWKLGDTSPTTTPTLAKDCTTNPNICVFTTNWNVGGGNPTNSSVIETYTYALSPVSTPGWDNSAATAAAASITIASGVTGFSAGETLAFKRNNTTPQAAFNASITNTISVQDASEAAVSGNGTITTTTPLVYSAIAFDAGPSANLFRYGRLRIGSASGSQLVNMQVPLETQYWNGTVFATNAADYCTTIDPASIAMASFLGSITAGETANISGSPFVAGRGDLRLRAPGAGTPPTDLNTGSVDLTINLDGTLSGTTWTSTLVGTPVATTLLSASRSYLQGNWTGATYTQNPSARARFGVYRGAEEVIFMRESY
jgi:MSHA biogenesis protein MshQ